MNWREERLAAEVEQLRGDLERLSDHYQNLMRECDMKDAEIERLHRIKTAAAAWVNVVESHPDDGTESEEYVDAAHALFHALGRTACESCQL